jgi:glycosyltransferase involved in cell wall biosynthesis
MEELMEIDYKPRVSIGLPVYNGEDYLSEAIDSILSQTYEDFELLISDNASTDNTQEICEKYAAQDKRVFYTRSPENLGAAKNYNILLEYASGEYFKWAAHDDFLDPGFLERCVEALDQDDSVVLAYPRSKLCDPDGKPFGKYGDGLNLESPIPHQRFKEFLMNPGLCHAVFGLIRLSALRNTARIGNFPRSDRNLLGELALHGKFYEVPDYLFSRRFHPNLSSYPTLTEYDLAVWFDPNKKGEMIFPRWRRLAEYLNAINRAPISFSEKIICIAYLGRFIFMPEKWTGLLNDIIIASKQRFTWLKLNK